jgi:hypothetical protein
MTRTGCAPLVCKQGVTALRHSEAAWHPAEGLTSLEEQMCAAAATDERVDLDGGTSDQAAMREWAADRTVRAAVLRHLLIADSWPVDATGVRLSGCALAGCLIWKPQPFAARCAWRITISTPRNRSASTASLASRRT